MAAANAEAPKRLPFDDRHPKAIELLNPDHARLVVWGGK
jgi:hypothetical protein